MKPIRSVRHLAQRLGVSRSYLETLASRAGAHYDPFTRKNGERVRIIDNPSAELKEVQTRIYRTILQPVELPLYVQGGVKSRSPVTNARLHTQHAWLVRIDVKKFFPSITNGLVYSVFVQLGCIPDVANLLTKLTTFRGHLPQGAPTSTAIANLVLLELDAAMNSAALNADAAYSRFVDDLNVSGPEPRPLVDTAVRGLNRLGLRVSRHKLNLMHCSQPQVVTGLMVNTKPSVPRAYQDNVRAAIHRLYDAPVADLETLLKSILGRVGYIERTNKGAARRLRRQIERRKLEVGQRLG